MVWMADPIPSFHEKELIAAEQRARVTVPRFSQGLTRLLGGGQRLNASQVSQGVLDLLRPRGASKSQLMGPIDALGIGVAFALQTLGELGSQFVGQRVIHHEKRL